MWLGVGCWLATWLAGWLGHLAGQLAGQLAGHLAGQLAGQLASWLARWLAAWLISWLATCQAGWLATCLASWLTSWLAGQLFDRPADWPRSAFGVRKKRGTLGIRVGCQRNQETDRQQSRQNLSIKSRTEKIGNGQRS